VRAAGSGGGCRASRRRQLLPATAAQNRNGAIAEWCGQHNESSASAAANAMALLANVLGALMHGILPLQAEINRCDTFQSWCSV
jgi:hypothetical protein